MRLFYSMLFAAFTARSSIAERLVNFQVVQPFPVPTKQCTVQILQ
jgi:hypothetical protein